jgi:hypothetical protein
MAATERDEVCVEVMLAILEAATRRLGERDSFTFKLSMLLGLAVHICAEAGYRDRDKLASLLRDRFDEYEREIEQLQ